MTVVIEDYEAWVDTLVKWGGDKRVIYPALGLAGEAGEVVDRLKKLYRGCNQDTPLYAAAFGDEETLFELGDVLYYLTALAHDLGFTMADVVDANQTKLNERHKTSYYKIMEAAR
jgi:NTP pyrophosphatase (non-canonical NTP hydrolase)